MGGLSEVRRLTAQDLKITCRIAVAPHTIGRRGMDTILGARRGQAPARLVTRFAGRWAREMLFVAVTAIGTKDASGVVGPVTTLTLGGAFNVHNLAVGGGACRKPSCGMGIRGMTIETRHGTLSACEGIAMTQLADILFIPQRRGPMQRGCRPSILVGVCGMTLGARYTG